MPKPMARGQEGNGREDVGEAGGETGKTTAEKGTRGAEAIQGTRSEATLVGYRGCCSPAPVDCIECSVNTY